MIELLIASVIYVIGWITAAATGMRTLAGRVTPCERDKYDRLDCDHVWWGHWRGDGQIGRRETIVAALAALAWPLLWLPAAAYLLANRRPTPRAMEHRTAELEREAGIR